MALCAADSLCRGFDPADMMKKFSAWMTRRQYTATGVRFDIGNTTRQAIQKYEMGLDPADCGDASEQGNGNGALMRTFPVSLMQCLKADGSIDALEDFLDPVHRAARLTHAHERGLICCGVYTLMLHAWLNRREADTLLDALSHGFERAQRAYAAMGGAYAREIRTEGLFVHPRKLKDYPMERIESSGYVIHTLHAALWCLLTTDNYADCVLKAVNLGEDTDTTAAVAGSLAGVIYGRDAIPAGWLEKLKNKKLIVDICESLNSALLGRREEQKVIDSFIGENAHLALKAAASITLEGLRYDNAAAAFLAQGVPQEERTQFTILNAHQARRLVKQLPCREGWDDRAREDALHAVCLAKYAQNPALAEKLINTGSMEIIYDTTGAHDNEMGRCACDACAGIEARNLYGKMLMRVREELMALGHAVD